MVPTMQTQMRILSTPITPLALAAMNELAILERFSGD